MTEQEQKDLDFMKESIQKEKLNFFDYVRDLVGWMLRNWMECGHRGKTPAEAVFFTFSDSTENREVKQRLR